MSTPLHDWSRVPADLFHDFHQSWTVQICDRLNAGGLPDGFAALVEPHAGLAATLESSTELARRTPRESYARRANRINVTRQLRHQIAVVEVVSLGNKDSLAAINAFVEKVVGFLSRRVHVLVVDLFPPSAYDPNGIHGLIWDEIGEPGFELPKGKDRTLVSYHAGETTVAYVEPVSVGSLLCDMPLFLGRDAYVLVPLPETYHVAWNATPEIVQKVVETGELPPPTDK